MVVVVLLSVGAHVPVIPLFEVVGKAVRVPPEQIDATAVNVGVTWALITISIVAIVAHGSVGVNVYVVVPKVAVLITAGFHVPVNPLEDVAGNGGAVLFWQIGPICVKAGVTCALITMSIVVTVAQGSVGVKV